MDLFNQFFYLSFALIVLVIFFGATHERQLGKNDSSSIFWPVALGLMVVSAVSFALIPYGAKYFLTLANTTSLFSALAIGLLIRSWNRPLPKNTLTYFWVGYLFAFGLYEVLRQYVNFEARVHIVNAFNAIMGLWSLLELHHFSKKERSSNLIILKLAFVARVGLLSLRSVTIYQAAAVGATIYQEGPFTSIVRTASIAFNLIIYIAISNIYIERLLKKEKKKSSSTEAKMLSSLNALALARDNETGKHIIRTQAYVKILAASILKSGRYTEQLSHQKIDQLVKAAPLHDIGKVGVPDSILYKPESLTKDEWGVMKTHATIGEQILSSAQIRLDDEDEDDDGGVIAIAIEIAGSHHERWDGYGYPRGLSQENIPLSARIMALADMYDALMSSRVYKRSWSHVDAVNEITSKKGTHFDPYVVEAFVSEVAQFEAIALLHQDEGDELKTVTPSTQTSEQKLHRSEQKFQALFQYSPIGMAMIDYATGEFLEANQALLNYTGFTKSEFLTLTFWDITPPEYFKQEEEQKAQLNRTGLFGPNEKEYIRKDGSRFEILIRGFMLSEVDGRKVVWGIIEDISLQKKLLVNEISRQKVLEMLATNIPLDLVLNKLIEDIEKSDPGLICSILLMNESRTRFTMGAAPNVPPFFTQAIEQLEIGLGVGCCGEAAFTGQPVFAENLATDPNWATATELAARAGFQSCWSQPIYSSKGLVIGTFASYRSTQHLPSEDEKKIITDAANLAAVILERRGLESQIQQLAFYDALTQLPNRSLLLDRLNGYLTASKRLRRYGAMLFIDLDALKQLNDRDGHYVGDLLLIETAKRLRASVREVDTVARFGGDEFVVILSSLGDEKAVSLELAKGIAEKIRRELEPSYALVVDGTVIHHQSTASIGCKLFFGDDVPEDILRLSDMSMYRAKKRGGNQIDLFD